MNQYVTGAVIKELREKYHLTQAELAEKLNVSDKTVSKWETAKGYPDISLLEPIARVFGISVTELISGNAVSNVNVSANMMRSKFYVCPVCGNSIHSMGEAVIQCHGLILTPCQAEETDENHMIFIEKVEDEYYVRIEHDMTKLHYISFIAALSPDKLQMVKLYPEGNAELLSQKQRLLNEEVQATKEKLEALKTASEQANAALERGTISKDQYDALQREIIATEQVLEDLEEQAEQSAVALQKIANAGESLKSAGDKVTDVGKKMSVVSAGIVAAGTASTKAALDFEDAMAKVSTIADATEVPIDELEKAILDLSNQTGISSTEIADNVYNAISAGQSTGDAVNFVTNSTKLAKAGFADAGDALDILTTILNAYGLEASEVTNVSDMLIQTQNLGKTTVAELSSAMGKVIPTANAYGVQLDQLCAGYAIMTANGVATAESTTYMNSMLNELGKSGTKVSDILKEKTGSSFAELMNSGYSLSDCLAIIGDAATEQGLAFGDMWSSSEAAKAGLILLGDSAETFNGTLAEMQNSTGATDTVFEKLKTNSYTIQVAINQLKNTAIELRNAIMSVLAPLLMSLAETISKLTAWFSGLSDGTKRFIVIIGMVVAAVGPVLIIVGKIMSAVGTIMTVVPKLAGSGFYLSLEYQ